MQNKKKGLFFLHKTKNEILFQCKLIPLNDDQKVNEV